MVLDFSFAGKFVTIHNHFRCAFFDEASTESSSSSLNLHHFRLLFCINLFFREDSLCFLSLAFVISSFTLLSLIMHFCIFFVFFLLIFDSCSLNFHPFTSISRNPASCC